MSEAIILKGELLPLTKLVAQHIADGWVIYGNIEKTLGYSTPELNRYRQAMYRIPCVGEELA
jgi:hypothetical protein